MTFSLDMLKASSVKQLFTDKARVVQTIFAPKTTRSTDHPSRAATFAQRLAAESRRCLRKSHNCARHRRKAPPMPLGFCQVERMSGKCRHLLRQPTGLAPKFQTAPMEMHGEHSRRLRSDP